MAVVVVRAAVAFTVSVPFVLLPCVFRCHFKKGHLSSPADWAAQQSLQMTFSDVIGRVVIRELGGGQVFVVSVEPRDEEAGTPSTLYEHIQKFIHLLTSGELLWLHMLVVSLG